MWMRLYSITNSEPNDLEMSVKVTSPSTRHIIVVVVGFNAASAVTNAVYGRLIV